MATLTGYKRDIDGLYIDKDPESILVYTVDWTNWLASGESIIDTADITTGQGAESSTDTYTTSVTAEQLSGDIAETKLRVDSYAKHNNGKKINFVLSHGTPGKIYKVTIKIVTDENEVCEKFMRIVCKERSL